MIKTVKPPLWVNVLIIVAFLGVVVYVAKRRANAIDRIVDAEFYGKIVYFRHAGKSTMNVVLENDQGPYSILGFAKYRYEMRKGDSLSKDAGSEKLYYYKLKDSTYDLFDVFNLR